jgi:hypothetical protein
VGYIYCLSKGIKSITREQLNDWDMIALIDEAKAAVPKEVAEAWLDLAKRGCLANWVTEQIDAAVMERAAL